ncbi:hypothetical protein [Phytohabitans suffuscus]|uniref:Uncharacterized protein n=1 Tax=Phytohabitans suffuscus TaxID=624315 RepID=A0A6F8YU03_9ACTN|nr:hypothetical protein [Phytohabitans suffuscus]BCB89549.1 hypothetical protein Psuf_068620 [Phytohabitans suffuscus]
MNEKERCDANREARHDAAANRDQSPERRADVIARFVGALLYGGARRPERERDRKPPEGGHDTAA